MPKQTARDREPAPGASDDAQARLEFERAMAGVVPLPEDPRGRLCVPPPRLSSPGPTRSRPGPDANEADSALDDFVAQGVDRREIRRLKRGDYPPQDELDLHGKTVQEACAKVRRFIENSRHARLRCVCIVHGRGLNSADGVSKLKGPVRACLIAMNEVLACAVAPGSAGGAGALYVLLRR